VIRKLCTSPRTFLVSGVFMSAALVSAFTVAGKLRVGLVCGGIMLGYTLLIVVGRRWSPTLEVLSGTGDERTQSILIRAAAQAGSFLACVIAIWWVVSVAVGHANQTLNLLAAIFGATFIVAVLVTQRRS